jgi:starvation-inducible DNA-binding protein
MKTSEKQQVKNDVLVNGMNEFLADLQIFYQNLRGFHWNVKGTLFFVLHAKFEEYYNESAEWVDEVAERILTLGGEPLHAFSDYLKVASLPEIKNVGDGKKTVEYVVEQSETLLTKMQKLQIEAAEQNDEGTNAMLSEMIGETEKRLWMLKTFLS